MRLRSFLLAFCLLISGFALAADPTGTNTTGGGNSTTEGNNTKQGNSVSNCTQGSSQNGFPAGTNTCTGTTPAGYTAGPGDVVSGATYWYGLRAYTAAIAAAGTQKLINIRNIATSETCDVIVATNGGFGNVANCSGGSSGDTVAVFCAESSSSCAVTEAYDQSGNGNNIVQATAGSQPALTLSCLGSLPCLSSSGSKWVGTAAVGTAPSNPFTISGVGNRTGGFTSESALLSTGGATKQMLGWTTSANTAFVGNTGVSTIISATANDSAWHAFQGITVTGVSASTLNVDGTSTTGTLTDLANNFIAIMAETNGNVSLVGDITEVGIWSGVGFSSTQMTNMCHNQYTYWGTSTSC